MYEETLPLADGEISFSVEFLPGQFDQRADSAQQCVKLLNEDEDALIRSATTYVVKGDLTDEQLEAVKEYCINPVDSREAAADKPETLVMDLKNQQMLRFWMDSKIWKKTNLKNYMIL